ncbi:hypothetical protein AXF42_Ash005598 [Apostasia shenzhenica]|uniref:Glycosyl transferase family 1 domain-containing protein n=1 Tax=Apostasia shenzhenica TaxID=1088818 RepID=A0A2I0BBT6_9ASPA|nr:hypothetical protein AXF42_Ash005598 [Apostasia shenzhenica]
MRIQVNLLPLDMKYTIDWLDYSGILASSVEARLVISSLLQEPFKSIPVIWIIEERCLAIRLSQYLRNGMSGIYGDWKQVFSRATVVVFSNYYLPILYSAFDAGNFFVIPSSVGEAWAVDSFLASSYHNKSLFGMAHRSEDFLIAIVGSQFEYSGMWLELALVLQGLSPLLRGFQSYNVSYPVLKVGILSRNPSTVHENPLETVALSFDYPKWIVEHIAWEDDNYRFLGMADLVIYGSFLEEQSFPSSLLQAMSLGKLVIAPDLDVIKKYIDDGVTGYLYPKYEVEMLSQIIRQAISNGKLTPVAQKIAKLGQGKAKNLMVSETIQGYSWLLENVLKFPSEISTPKKIEEISSTLKEEWQWHPFVNIGNTKNFNRMTESCEILDMLEEEWIRTHRDANANNSSRLPEAFLSINWEEQRMIEIENAKKMLEEDELKDRTDQPHGLWEEVYRSAKRADRAKNELHERDERELERIGQPLCIYEPYFGEGTWPFLHNSSLYRGIGLSPKGRRPGADDVDATSRLPLLGNAYYREALVEYGAFFALANRIDRIHKNAWIGFQSWRVGARKACLSKNAEKALLQSIQTRKHGDSFYFWVRMDEDPRNSAQQDFWSFCDAINSGNCRFIVSETLHRMYGISDDWDSLPPMPEDGGTWSTMHSWVLPTRSFLEFVMFSRMFVDALDSQMYEQHYQSGYCYLSLTKDKHCYSRVLELLINVWVYHSARRMIYVNPETGVMQEHHIMKNRRGKMWIKWFSFATLKSMDEDLAEEADSDSPRRRWLWPSTGEVFWQGIYERERSMRHHQREKRRQQSKDKIRRIRSRVKQKSLGKYIKPPPEDAVGEVNITATTRTS